MTVHKWVHAIFVTYFFPNSFTGVLYKIHVHIVAISESLYCTLPLTLKWTKEFWKWLIWI